MPPLTHSSPLSVVDNRIKHLVRHRTPNGIQFPLAWAVTTYCNKTITGVTEAHLRGVTNNDTCPACLAHHQYARQRTRSETHAAQ